MKRDREEGKTKFRLQRCSGRGLRINIAPKICLIGCDGIDDVDLGDVVVVVGGGGDNRCVVDVVVLAEDVH